MISQSSFPAFAAPQFRLVNADSVRSDLAARREVKYALRGADVAKLRSLLECNCSRLIHNEPVSMVRSIYFDDARLSACRANLDGIGRRRKLRLRWYDSLRPDRDFFLETKWRENRVTGKHRLHLQADAPIHKLSFKQIAGGLEQAVPTEQLDDVLRFSEPIVIVQYRREHFTVGDGCLRVTLDYDITYYDQTGRQFISTTFARHLHGLVVLEGKTPLGREAELRALLYPFTPRVGRCSKYVHGCCQLGLIRASEQ